MAALNTTTFAYALKKLYTKKEVQNLAYKASRSPYYAMVPKWEQFGGANFVEPVAYGDIAGRATVFGVAQANKAASKGTPFTITRVKDYGLCSIDSETILASQGSENALLESLKREMNSGINAVGRSLAIGCYGNGSGELGSISAITSGVATLVDTGDVTNFEVGQQVVAATADTATPRAAVGEVTAIDRDAGTVTFNSGVDPTSWAAADEMFTEGDYVAASDRLKISGLRAWVPDSAPGATAFFGVTRSTDTTRLGGCRIDGSALRIDEAIFKCAVRVAREGGVPDSVFLSFEQYEALINVLGSKLEYQTTDIAGVGFEGCKIIGPSGSLKVYPDLNCPKSRAYVLQMDTWKLRSLGAAPRILDIDGNRMQREATADAWEVRIAFFGNLSCCAPGWNGVVHSIP